MSSKRRQSIKRQGKQDFCPDTEPTFRYNGNNFLTDYYDKKCYMEGWNQAESEYHSQLKRELDLLEEEDTYINY